MSTTVTNNRSTTGRMMIAEVKRDVKQFSDAITDFVAAFRTSREREAWQEMKEVDSDGDTIPDLVPPERHFAFSSEEEEGGDGGSDESSIGSSEE
mmetsp:Transcript_48003/g.58128  ORF Transcript_48003/g.58128 Transcript_48003/m.58128 type:complete len:95 (-) Transcript_48003:136-420(-)|eukprot:CAMPEP_0172511280 /NCGR_PEP_ID=MMETSP1066-20121228/235220_1 /TAXON_ID=671091 /ORGANISM="Coscinodiscus wailesii, Strain CCMP2513" /LENGTH=94 /DNA_ID=CAMNT_0013290591 /DNA_START=202 /DNA_END=486 /DNA_ORIENTATION=+